MRSAEVAAAADAGGVALLPVGATEQHGQHLPITTDALIAEALAVACAASMERPAWVLPTLSYGRSIEHAGYAGTVSLSARTLLAVVDDVARDVAASGFRTLVFVNAHGGNPELLRVAARDIRAQIGIHAYLVHAPDIDLPDELGASIPRPDVDVHAGYYETSVMLALAPELVALPLSRPDGIEAVRALDDAGLRLDGPAALPWFTRDLSPSGVIGDPTGADAVWGRAALDHQGRALAGLVERLADHSELLDRRDPAE